MAGRRSWLYAEPALVTDERFDLYSHTERTCLVSARWSGEAVEKAEHLRCLRSVLADAEEQLGPRGVDSWDVCWELVLPLEVVGVTFPRKPAMGTRGSWRCRLFYEEKEVASWQGVQNTMRNALKGEVVCTEMELYRLRVSAKNTLRHVFHEKKGTRRDGTWAEEMSRTIQPELRVSSGKYRVSLRTHEPLERARPARRRR